MRNPISKLLNVLGYLFYAFGVIGAISIWGSTPAGQDLTFMETVIIFATLLSGLLFGGILQALARIVQYLEDIREGKTGADAQKEIELKRKLASQQGDKF